MPDDLLKRAKEEVAILRSGIKYLGYLRMEEDSALRFTDLIQELSDALKEKDKKLEDALGWKKYYEKENERQHLYLESYGRRLDAIRHAYYIEDVPPGIEEWVKKHDKPQPQKDKQPGC